MEELTSGASGRIIPLFNRAKSMALFIIPSYHFFKKFIVIFYSSFLCFLLLLLPPSQRHSSTEDSPVPAKFRRRRLVEEEEDTIRRRAFAEALKMVPDGGEEEEREFCRNCRWKTSLFCGVRRNALFCRSWFPVSGNPKYGLLLMISVLVSCFYFVLIIVQFHGKSSYFCMLNFDVFYFIRMIMFRLERMIYDHLFTVKTFISGVP